MTSVIIKASYNKNEHSTEMKPTITNTVTVNAVGSTGEEKLAFEADVEHSPSKVFVEPKIEPSPLNPLIRLPPKASLLGKVGVSVEEDKRVAFEKRLLGICLAVLSTNDKVLINNIIDVTGDIILSITDLRELITIITGASEVSIVTGDNPVVGGCLKIKKLPIWVPITKIIVNGQDFYVGYNRIHTMFAEYRVTLEKTII